MNKIYLSLVGLRSIPLSVIFLSMEVVLPFACFLFGVLCDGIDSLFYCFFKKCIPRCCLSVCIIRPSPPVISCRRWDCYMISSNFISFSFFPSHSIIGSMKIVFALTIFRSFIIFILYKRT
jgi:hypothetical protein